jgi:hypothetical protein
MEIIQRPNAGDYPAYYEPYLNLVPEGDMIACLEEQRKGFLDFCTLIPEDRGNFAYAPEKWTVKEVISHIIDTERIMAFRALAISRGEKQSIPGFDENDYVKHSEVEKRTMEDLLEEFDSLRQSNLCLFRSFSEAQLQKRGSANQKEVSVLALMCIVCGHLMHHVNILRERYLD